MTLPAFVAFQEPRPTSRPPTGSEWLHEPKLPGRRFLVRIEDGDVRWIDQTRTDRSELFGDFAPTLGKLTACILDCQLCAYDSDGRATDAQVIDALSRRRQGDFDARVALFAFDLLHWAGEDLRVLRLSERKAWLQSIVYSHGVPVTANFAHVEGLATKVDGRVDNRALAPDVDEVISKRLDSEYRSGGSPATWVRWSARTANPSVYGA